MARFRRGQGGAVVLGALLVLGILRAPVEAANDTYYDRPVLTINPGMHRSVITAASVDVAGRFAVTGSNDKTVRIWSLCSGKLVRTIPVPAGPGNVGKVYAVAMSPDGSVVAAGGYTGPYENQPIYLFDRNAGRMIAHIAGHQEVVGSLVFSPDGRYLAAGLAGAMGLRVFDRDKNWSEIFGDTEYGDGTYGASFSKDGRLVTASLDGKIRLYDRNFRLVVPPVSAPSGIRPYAVAFSPDGSAVAVGYEDAAAVDLFDGWNLSRLPGPDLGSIKGGGLLQVAWSLDGQTLYASGIYPNGGGKLLLFWDRGGHGKRLSAPACGDDAGLVTALVPLPERKLLVAAGNPCLSLLDTDLHAAWTSRSPTADFRNQYERFAISSDGAIVDFGFEEGGKSPLRFDVRRLTLSSDPGADGVTRKPQQDGITITDWFDSYSPKIHSQPIPLRPGDFSRSLAIDPQARYFVLGTSWSLRAIDTEGKSLWQREVPGEVWAVNISGDGRLVVAAYHDGTIRWHRSDDGRELLALQVLADKKNWVLWTPEGFYAATPGAHGVLRWLVNREPYKAAKTFPVSAIPRLYRPDALPFVLQERETARALGIADLAKEVDNEDTSKNPAFSRLNP